MIINDRETFEVFKQMIDDARKELPNYNMYNGDKIIKENGIKNVELHNMDASKFFEKELNTKGRKFDVTVLDPPRKGCTEVSLDYAMKLTKGTIIYVSCNPATLARDLKYLIANGCKVEYIQPFDMFPHTYHVESVAIIKK